MAIQPEAEPAIADDPAPYGKPAEPGRNKAFRRHVLEHYDYQCAACGLRIRLRQQDLVCVEAAHLVPFKDSHNDHPSNGIALCRHHHWAMDSHLIAPTRDRVWRASPVLDARRSRGERQLLELSGSKLMEPKKVAYRPWDKGLEWREEHLLGG